MSAFTGGNVKSLTAGGGFL